MSAGLAEEQFLTYAVGTVHISGIQEHIGHDENSMICRRTSYAPSEPQTGRTRLRESS